MKTVTHEFADGIYRFSTCVPEAAPGGFTLDPRRMFPLVSDAIAMLGRA